MLVLIFSMRRLHQSFDLVSIQCSALAFVIKCSRTGMRGPKPVSHKTCQSSWANDFQVESWGGLHAGKSATGDTRPSVLLELRLNRGDCR